MAAEASTYAIQNRTIGFPVRVRDASSAAALFAVPSRVAARHVPEPFEVAQIAPGRALLSLAVVDYRDNDLGDYNEMAIGFMVHPRGEAPTIPWIGTLGRLLAGRLASHIIHMPVDQSFTRDAGETIWGYPKTVQTIEIEYADDRVRGRLVYDGEHAFTLTLPRGGRRRVEGGTIETLSMIDGVPHRTVAGQTLDGMGIRPGGAAVELGTGPIAETLRDLGLPKRALMSTWIGKMTASFGPPIPIR